MPRLRDLRLPSLKAVGKRLDAVADQTSDVGSTDSNSETTVEIHVHVLRTSLGDHMNAARYPRRMLRRLSGRALRSASLVIGLTWTILTRNRLSPMLDCRTSLRTLVDPVTAEEVDLALESAATQLQVRTVLSTLLCAPFRPVSCGPFSTSAVTLASFPHLLHHPRPEAGG